MIWQTAALCLKKSSATCFLMKSRPASYRSLPVPPLSASIRSACWNGCGARRNPPGTIRKAASGITLCWWWTRPRRSGKKAPIPALSCGPRCCTTSVSPPQPCAEKVKSHPMTTTKREPGSQESFLAFSQRTRSSSSERPGWSAITCRFCLWERACPLPTWRG